MERGHWSYSYKPDVILPQMMKEFQPFTHLGDVMQTKSKKSYVIDVISILHLSPLMLCYIYLVSKYTPGIKANTGFEEIFPPLISGMCPKRMENGEWQSQ